MIENRRRLADYQPRIGLAFDLQGELDAKLAELAALEDSLAKTSADEGDAADTNLDDLLNKLRRVDEQENES